jgi:ParB/RepB/Spo0J family partition protein
MSHPPAPTVTNIKVASLFEFRSRHVYKALDELAESLKKGQIEPLVVRAKTTGKKTVYEIAAGTRRRRAAVIAGLDTLECIVRELTDQQMVEISIAENRDREDIHPLEEADALVDLHGKYGQTIDEMAARFGRSSEYVWGRMKIAKMHADLRVVFLAGRFGVKGALLLAGVAETMQARVWGELSKLPDATLSAAKIGTFIRDRFLLRLATAPFPITDASLVERAGECMRCPKRTGVQSSLFPDDITSEDRCTDLDCFVEKKQAFAEVLVERATKKGLVVLEKTDAREVFKYGESIEILNPDCKFVAVDGKVRLGEASMTYRELLESGPPPVMIAINPGGAGLELYEKIAVAKAMRACKVPFVKEWESVCIPKGKPEKGSTTEKQDRTEVKQERRAAELAILGLREQVATSDDASPIQRKKLMQLVALGAARNTWSQVQKAYIKLHKLDDGKTGGDANTRILVMLEDHIGKLNSEQCSGFVFELALLREVFGSAGGPDLESEIFKRGMAVTGLRYLDFQKQARKGQDTGKSASDDSGGPATRRSSPKPKVTTKRGKKAAARKKAEDVGTASSMGGVCAICSCTRAEPCVREIDDKKHTCTRAAGEELCSLCEEIFDAVDAAVEGKTHPFRFDEVFGSVLNQDLVEDSDGDRDVVRECLGRLIEQEKVTQLEDGRYRLIPEA